MNDFTDAGQLQDPLEPIDARRKQLEQRRKLAQALVLKSLGDTNPTIVRGNVMRQNVGGDILSGFFGNAMTQEADKQGVALDQQEAQRRAAEAPNITPDAKVQAMLKSDDPEIRKSGLKILTEQPQIDAMYGWRKDQQDEKDRLRDEATRQKTYDLIGTESKNWDVQTQLLGDRVEKRKLEEQRRTEDKDFRAALHNDTIANRPEPRPRYSVQTGADGIIYRVDLDTGIGTPVNTQATPTAAPTPMQHPMNETQANSTVYGTRAAEAHNVLEQVGTNYSPTKVVIANSMTDHPLIGGAFNATMMDGNDQKVVQAQRDFINATLRRESGASISKSEFDNARAQYFPQEGDSAEVLAQKKRNRETVIKGMGLAAGSGQSAVTAARNTPAPTASKKAPQAALDRLKAHPELAADFKRKYGYLP